MTECSLPPERAGRAPQASRHSNKAGLVLRAGGREISGPGDGFSVRLAPVAEVATGLGLEGGLEPVADADTESIRVLLEQALTMDTKPTLPASRSSRRRLQTSGRSSDRSRAGASMALTIRTQFSLGRLYRLPVRACKQRIMRGCRGRDGVANLAVRIRAVRADGGLRQMLGVVVSQPLRPRITRGDVLSLGGQDVAHRQLERLWPWRQQQEAGVVT